MTTLSQLRVFAHQALENAVKELDNLRKAEDESAACYDRAKAERTSAERTAMGAAELLAKVNDTKPEEILKKYDLKFRTQFPTK